MSRCCHWSTPNRKISECTHPDFSWERKWITKNSLGNGHVKQKFLHFLALWSLQIPPISDSLQNADPILLKWNMSTKLRGEPDLQFWTKFSDFTSTTNADPLSWLHWMRLPVLLSVSEERHWSCLERKKDIFDPTCADQPLPSTFIEFPEFYITELPKKFLITWLIPFCRTHCWRSWYPFPSRSWLPSFYPSTTRLFLEGQQASFHLSKTQLDVSPLFFLVLLLWRAQYGLLFLYYKLHYQGPNTLSCFPWGLFFKKLWATFKLKVNWISWMSTSH